MMTRTEAIEYGRRIGCQYYIYKGAGCLMGGTKTLAAAEAMKTRFEIEDRKNPWTKGTTTFYISRVKPTH